MNRDDSLNFTSDIKKDNAGLSAAQMRLIRSIHSMLLHISSVKNEEEFFEGSAELMRMVAQAVQQSDFVQSKGDEEINYAEQAVEFAIDVVNEALQKRKVISYDN
jgi:hypothetical protein